MTSSDVGGREPGAEEPFARWLDGWDPPASVVEDAMNPASLLALAATLDRPPPRESTVPLLWHWLYFLRWAPTNQLGPDGHPTSGPLLPPIPGRSRIFGGARFVVRAPLRCAVPARRRSVVAHWTVKQGRTGTMLLVTERHEIEQAGTLVLEEEIDVIYRSGPALAQVARDRSTFTPVASDATWQAPFRASSALLFRFSALTANTHRIHYDWRYATTIEGYQGLVVHGPLLAIAMVALAMDHHPTHAITALDLRMRRPVFADEPVLVTGQPTGRNSVLLAIIGDDAEKRTVADLRFAE